MRLSYVTMIFCNSRIFGLPQQQTRKLQIIQNAAARLVTRTRKYDSITPILRNLHWLPVHKRIQFKLIVFAFECFHRVAPEYLSELLISYKPTRSLRSGTKNLFVVPSMTTKSYGEHSFVYAAPVPWNALPNDLRNIIDLDKFKAALKKHLFNS